jgi:CheY-like chemotaxis protein
MPRERSLARPSGGAAVSPNLHELRCCGEGAHGYRREVDVARSRGRSARPGPGPARLLVVEDDRVIADAVTRRLASEGFSVDTVHDGMAAVAAVESTRYDAVVLDVMLPSLDGLEVCRRIQAGRPVPVLMLTARAEEADRINRVRPAARAGPGAGTGRGA